MALTPAENDHKPPAPHSVGLMADSHGDAECIDTAADFLLTAGCTQLVHLGDIGDTVRPETLAPCLARLDVHGIKPIRGNNDHTLLQNRSPQMDPEILAAIKAMPLVRRIGSALLAHSLPFADAMGPRCMLEDMGAAHIRLFFEQFPDAQFFRGHSHQPEIIRPQATSFDREALQPGRPYALASGQPAVITCGALTAGLCLFWDRRQETIELVRLPGI